MVFPPWLQNEGAWIALGVSLVSVIAALVMHRVVLNVLKGPAEEPRADAIPSKEPSPHE